MPNLRRGFLFCIAVVLGVSTVDAQDLIPQDPITAIKNSFISQQLVLLGDMHGKVQEHRMLVSLIESQGFSQVVKGIVLEGTNALYQRLVDRYLAGENISVEQLEPVWRNGIAIGPVD